MAIDSTRAVGCADSQGMAMRLGRYGRSTPTASPVGTGSAKTVLPISRALRDWAVVPPGAEIRGLFERPPSRDALARVGACVDEAGRGVSLTSAAEAVIVEHPPAP